MAKDFLELHVGGGLKWSVDTEHGTNSDSLERSAPVPVGECRGAVVDLRLRRQIPQPVGEGT